MSVTIRYVVLLPERAPREGGEAIDVLVDPSISSREKPSITSQEKVTPSRERTWER